MPYIDLQSALRIQFLRLVFDQRPAFEPHPQLELEGDFDLILADIQDERETYETCSLILHAHFANPDFVKKIPFS